MPFERPDGATPLHVDGVEVGCVAEGWLARVLEAPTPFALREGVVALVGGAPTLAGRSAAIAAWADGVRARHGVFGWRDERVVIRDEDEDDGPDVGRIRRPLVTVERALLRPLGLLLRSVQACVYTIDGEGPLVWVARRGPHKPVEPNRLDALVAGGIAGFDDPLTTLVRECAEEAGLPERIARIARPAGTLALTYAAIDDGLAVTHRERVLLHALELPPDLVPRAVDGEHAEILAMRPSQALESIDAGAWTRDGAQATRDLLHRLGALSRQR